MPTAQVCQPLAISPPKKPVAAAADRLERLRIEAPAEIDAISCALKLWRPIQRGRRP